MFSGKGYRRYKGGVAHDRVQKHTQKRQVQSRNGYKKKNYQKSGSVKSCATRSAYGARGRSISRIESPTLQTCEGERVESGKR